MPWQPKSTAPATFNLADALVALITGDATWGWLIDWLPYISNDHFSTADFCAFGPTPAPDLSVALGPSPPDRNPLSVVGKIATVGVSLTVAARDRVFGAYCENVDVLVGGWGDWQTYEHTGDQNTTTTLEVLVPSGASSSQWQALTGGQTTRTDGNVFLRDVTLPDTNEDTIFEGAGDGSNFPSSIATRGINNTHAYYIFSKYGYRSTFRFRFNAVNSTPVDYTPAAQAQPAGVLSPLQTVEPTLEGIAHELEFLELKSDTLRTLVQYIAGATLDLGGPTGDPADIAPDSPVQVGDAVGCIITVSNIPASRTLDFGTPQNVVKLAHVNFGTDTAWYPSIWLTHTPMIVRPFPPGTTRVTITGLPPGVTATIAMISRTK